MLMRSFNVSFKGRYQCLCTWRPLLPAIFKGLLLLLNMIIMFIRFLSLQYDFKKGQICQRFGFEAQI